MQIVLFRAIILYALIIFSIRLMGKRQLGELQPSEFVITIMLSNIATLPIQDINLPLLMGVITILTIVSLDVLISACNLKSKCLRKWVCGSPKIVINNGIIDQKMLKELRFTIDDLLASLRAHDVFDVNDVQYAIVETTGSVNVFLKHSAQPCTAGMLEIKGETKNPPQIIIDDGKIVYSSLSVINQNQSWLTKMLEKRNVKLKDVFLMTADDNGVVSLIKRSKTK